MCVLGLLLSAIVATTFLSTPRASAADIGGSLTNVEATITGPATVPANNQFVGFRLQFDACVPNSAQVGDTWQVTLPASLRNYPTTLTITNPSDSSETWITVTVTGTVATYTLTDAGAAVDNMCFGSEYGATQWAANQPQGQHTFVVSVVGGPTIEAGTVTVGPPVTGGSAYPPTAPRKQIYFVTSNDQCRVQNVACLYSIVALAGGDQGVVTITDTAGPNWAFVCSRTPRLIKDLYDNLGAVTYPSSDQSRLTIVSCSPSEVTFTVDTRLDAGYTDQMPAGSTAAYRVLFQMDALVPGGSGLVTYTNTATVAGTDVEWSATSSYVGGSASGAHIRIIKRDDVGSDANTAGAAVELPDGETDLVFAVINDGTQPLRNVDVSDLVTVGDAEVSDLACTLPDGSTGTTWAGPLATRASFSCTARLTGVAGAHTDVATVTAIGSGGEQISGSDPYNATAPELVSVGDLVWWDADHDGVQDAGESGIAGVTLTLLAPDGSPLATTVTDDDGRYLFADLPALAAEQAYTVEVAAPEGYAPTLENVGDATTDSSTGSATSTADLTSDGAQDLGLDFGFYLPVDLTLEKDLTSTGPVYPGDEVVFTLTPHNEGPGSALPGWSVTEVLPAGLSLVSMAGAGYVCEGATCVAQQALPSGEDGGPITVTATVSSTATSFAQPGLRLACRRGRPRVEPAGRPGARHGHRRLRDEQRRPGVARRRLAGIGG